MSTSTENLGGIVVGSRFFLILGKTKNRLKGRRSSFDSNRFRLFSKKESQAQSFYEAMKLRWQSRKTHPKDSNGLMLDLQPLMWEMRSAPNEGYSLPAVQNHQRLRFTGAKRSRTQNLPEMRQ